MSCNPAIGGLGKGQLVREIDALGGEMGINADLTGIQFRMLNTRKGPAVRSPRCQSEKKEYQNRIKYVVENQANLSIKQDLVDTILVDKRRVSGVVGQSGLLYRGRSIILTTGTFLRALMHTGESKQAGGRAAEPSAECLSETLKSAGFELGRLKTGTPPRIHGRTVDLSQCKNQPGDEHPVPFSFMHDAIDRRQIDCYITWTNPETHRILSESLERSPMYNGQIDSTGPRYCPSIEDKVVRFAEKDSHQIFLEPEGYDTWEFYANGISTSMPVDVQERVIRSIAGLENAEVLRYGYAVEYDFVPPHYLRPTFETRAVEGLYHAGQINGTSGYEEAGAQGMIAGVNAVRKLREQDPFLLDRSQAYFGVMADDLVTQEHIEPYRMFTSRAEHRLHLRGDNADLRLTPIGRELGIVSDERWSRFQHKLEVMEKTRRALREIRPGGDPLEKLLRQPEHQLESFSKDYPALAELYTEFREAVDQVEIDVKYEGYIKRQRAEIEKFKRLEDLSLPEDIDYYAITHLRNEAQRRLTEVRPVSLGQASRVAGVAPSDISVLMVHLNR
jgi:tRNA uridine 5-carboxymethylaminomethyl modification enzyme